MGVGLGNGIVFWYWAWPLSLFSTSSSLSTLLACLRFSRIWKKSSGLLYSCLNILDNIKWGAIRNFWFVGKDSDKAVNQQILAREGIRQKESSKLQMFKLLNKLLCCFLQGCLVPVKVHIPPGCLLDPSPSAAVVGGSVLTSQRVVDVVLKAFGVCAASQVMKS